MKKILLSFCLGISVISLVSSCNRHYNCECVDKNGVETSQSVLATNRSEAQNKCNEHGLLGHCEIK